MSETITPRYLSVTAACLYASMSSNTLMRHRDRLIICRLPGSKKLWIDRESIDAFMNSCREDLAAQEIVRRLAVS